MNLAKLVLIGSLILTSAAMFAQTTMNTTPTPGKPATINQRKKNQQDRIAQGVKSGQLTAGETSHLESQEAGINKEESGMRAQDNGIPPSTIARPFTSNRTRIQPHLPRQAQR